MLYSILNFSRIEEIVFDGNNNNDSSHGCASQALLAKEKTTLCMVFPSALAMRVIVVTQNYGPPFGQDYIK